MSAILEAIKKKPVGYFPLDDPTPFDDHSGYARVANMSIGTAGTGISLGNGFSKSTKFSNAAIGQFTVPVFTQGSEEQSFTVEAVIRVVAPYGLQAIASHTGAYDGMTVNGTVVAFSTKYLTTGECKVEYDLQQASKIHVVGVHTRQRNMLFVNGQLVATKDITDLQQADKFIATDGKLYSGQSATGQIVHVNGLGMYPRSLSAYEITRNYEEVNRNGSFAAGSSLNGVEIDLSLNAFNRFVDTTFQYDVDWSRGTHAGTSVDSSSLVPTYTNDLSLLSYWYTTIALDAANTTSIYGVALYWLGTSVAIDTSLDGVTWTAAVNGQRLSNIVSGFNPTGQQLFVRAGFAAGLATANLSSFRVVGFVSGTTITNENRVVTVSNATPTEKYPITNLVERTGLSLNNATISIGPDTSSGAVGFKTVELWIKMDTGNITASLAGFTSYINGVASSTILVGEWFVLHYTIATFKTDALSITGYGTLGKVVLYPSQLTAAQVKAQYDSYVGTPMLIADSTAALGVTEETNASTIYAHEWAIVSSG